MTEYQPYGVRHFLRELDPEGASELRRRTIPLADGSQLEKSAYADTDRISLPDLLVYRTLVLRRSPAQSRPPLSYGSSTRSATTRSGSGSPGRPPSATTSASAATSSRPRRPVCADVRALAAAGTPGDRIVAAARPGPIVVPLADAAYPEAWAEVDPSFPVPREAGTLSATVDVAEAGDYDVWLGGSLRQEGVLRVDGREVGSVRHLLNNSGQYMPLGTVQLSPGRHRVEVEIGGAGLLPGSHGTAGSIGPLVLSRGRDAERTVSVGAGAGLPPLRPAVGLDRAGPGKPRRGRLRRGPSGGRSPARPRASSAAAGAAGPREPSAGPARGRGRGPAPG